MNLTEHEAFVAMFYFLHDYWERHGKSEGDVLQILSDMQLWPSNDMPVDLAYWSDWQNAINKVLQKENPPTDHYLTLTKIDIASCNRAPKSVFKLCKAAMRFFVSLSVLIIILYIQYLVVKHTLT